MGFIRHQKMAHRALGGPEPHHHAHTQERASSDCAKARRKGWPSGLREKAPREVGGLGRSGELCFVGAGQCRSLQPAEDYIGVGDQLLQMKGGLLVLRAGVPQPPWGLPVGRHSPGWMRSAPGPRAPAPGCPWTPAPAGSPLGAGALRPGHAHTPRQAHPGAPGEGLTVAGQACQEHAHVLHHLGVVPVQLVDVFEQHEAAAVLLHHRHPEGRQLCRGGFLSWDCCSCGAAGDLAPGGSSRVWPAKGPHSHTEACPSPLFQELEACAKSTGTQQERSQGPLCSNSAAAAL